MRYRITVIPLAFVLLTCITIIAVRQDSRNSWLTKNLRVQYDSESPYSTFSGCYHISTEITRRDKRFVYESDENNVDEAKFGYCKESDKWLLFKGNSTSACEVEDVDVLAVSDKTNDFDISVTFEESWVRCIKNYPEHHVSIISSLQSFSLLLTDTIYIFLFRFQYSRTGTPLDMYFFDDEGSLDAEQCSTFLGDGVSMQSTEIDYGVCTFAMSFLPDKLNSASNHDITLFLL